MKGCTIPTGSRKDGFSPKGLHIHMQRIHPGVDTAEWYALSKSPTEAVAEGFRFNVSSAAQRILNENTSPIEDVRALLNPEWENQQFVTPRFNNGRCDGFYVRGRDTCCTWTRKGNEHAKGYWCVGDYISLNSSDDRETNKPYVRLESALDRHVPDPYKGPVEPSDNEGIRVKIRNGKLEVLLSPNEWTVMTLEQFVNNIRLAIAMS